MAANRPGLYTGAAMLLVSLAVPFQVAAQMLPSDQPVAIVGDRTFNANELEAVIGNRLMQLRAQLYAMTRLALDELIAQHVFTEEAKRLAITTQDLQQRLANTTPEVTEQEVRLVFEAMPDRFANLTEAQALEGLRKSMRERRLSERRRRYVQELRAKYNVRILLEPVRVALAETTGPALGSPDAPVVIVEFGDFQCPYCRQMVPIIRELLDRFEGKIRFVYKDMPLPSHPQASSAAEAAHCAGEQGHYWAMHDLLFENQRRLGSAFFVEAAKELGLEETRFTECMATGRHADRWRASQEQGRRYGVSGSPVFFVNGRPVTGVVTLEFLEEVVREEIAALGRLRVSPARE